MSAHERPHYGIKNQFQETLSDFTDAASEKNKETARLYMLLLEYAMTKPKNQKILDQVRTAQK